MAKILNYILGGLPKRTGIETHAKPDDSHNAAASRVHTNSMQKDSNNHMLSNDGSAVVLCVTPAK